MAERVGFIGLGAIGRPIAMHVAIERVELGSLCGLSGECKPDATCTGNGDCTDGIHGLCLDVSADMSGDKRCRECDPSNNNGCTSGTCA